jgi:SAM-dependent methyltransferase
MVENVHQELISVERRAAQRHWNAHPCGTGDYLDGIPESSREYFEAIRHHRYHVSDSWMLKTIDFAAAKDKKLLEVGHGIGTDLLTFCEHGAQGYGIDITEEHHRLAGLNFALHEMKPVLKVCDCAAIDFPPDYFDLVYSHGVLHHVQNVAPCIAEIKRVLRPGGLFIVGMYHTYSLHHLYWLLYHGLFRGQILKLGYRGLLSTVEYGADGINHRPYVKTYSRAELRGILRDFSRVRFKIAHITPNWVTKLNQLIPQKWIDSIESRWGWYILAFAEK